jgi:DNA-binding MarR family transcriptional regulator
VTTPEYEYDRQILQTIASGGRITQRSLASELGVALGLTNLLIRRLIGKGYVRVSRIGRRDVRYLMTPVGWKALRRTTRLSLQNTIHLYTQTREQIRATLAVVSERCEIDPAGDKRVVFYGAGDVAEIAYVSLQRTNLRLVGVVDDRRTGRFFDLPISSPGRLTVDGLDGTPYSLVIVTSIRHGKTIQRRIKKRGIPPSRVACL